MKLIKKYTYCFLIPITFVYSLVIFLRNLFYEKKFLLSKKLPCTVISIGNITAGGTGKTPTVIFLCSLLKNNGYRVAVLSRGYLRKTKGTLLVSKGNGPLCKWEDCGDEAHMMAKILQSTPIVVDKNRYRGGRYIIDSFNPDIIILDDGFQHRSLYRDLDIVLINGGDDIKDYKLLPNGKLREPWSNISRANIVLITKKSPKADLMKKIKRSSLNIYKTKTITFISTSSNQKNNNKSNDKNILLVSGIGDPNYFFYTAKRLGYNILGHESFPDHFSYKNKNILKIEEKAKNLGANHILTTEKDWVKLQNFDFTFSIIVLGIKLEIQKKKQLLNLLNHLPKSAPYPKQKQHQQK